MSSTHEAIVTALERAYVAPPLEGVKRPISHRQGLLARLSALEAAAGGEQAAARAAGVTPRTWRGWKRNPTARPSRASLEGVQHAYGRDLRRRSRDPVRQMRFALAKGRKARVKVWAEVQWAGYYNGQSERVTERQAAPPDPENRYAWRAGGVEFGTLDITAVVRAWKGGHDCKEPLDKIVSDDQGAWIFLNSYYRGAKVTL